MDFSNIKNKFFVVLCIFVVFLPFVLMTRIYASEVESVDFQIIDNLVIAGNRNYFSYQDNRYVGYFEIEKGYIYHINKIDGSGVAYIVGSTNIPDANVNYDIITSINTGDSFDYLSNNNNYLCISFSSNINGTTITVTREKIESMNGAVQDLVNTVGVNSIWNIFDIGINYIYVVVLSAFGIFIISLIIKKITKGKEGF